MHTSEERNAAARLKICAFEAADDMGELASLLDAAKENQELAQVIGDALTQSGGSELPDLLVQVAEMRRMLNALANRIPISKTEARSRMLGDL